MKTTLTHQSWPIAKFIEYDKNPRKNDHAVEQIAAAIEYFGFRIPIVAKSDGTVVDGHLRLKAARKLGMIKVPVVLADDMTDEQVKAFRISVNKMAELADWDQDLLRAELLDLQGIEFDMDLLGFDVETLEDLLFVEPERDNSKEDDVPEPPADPVSKLGDVWLCSRHRVLCGDSTKIEDVEKLMDGKKADMVFTDPPYGVDYDGSHAVNGIRREKLANDGSPDIYSDVLPISYLVSKDTSPLYLWFSDSKSAAVTAAVTAAGYEIRNTLIWNKNIAQFGAIGAQYKSKHEPCLYCFKKIASPYWNGPTNEVSVWDVSRAMKNEYHPTQKPVELPERAIVNSCPNHGVVIDFFLGSGSTLIAAEKTNRICYGMEISEKYTDVIVSRWQTYTNQQAIHEATGQTFDACRGNPLRLPGYEPSEHLNNAPVNGRAPVNGAPTDTANG